MALQRAPASMSASGSLNPGSREFPFEDINAKISKSLPATKNVDRAGRNDYDCHELSSIISITGERSCSTLLMEAWSLLKKSSMRKQY
jgi:hypothetical protein